MESKIKINPDSPLNSTVFDGRPDRDRDRDREAGRRQAGHFVGSPREQRQEVTQTPLKNWAKKTNCSVYQSVVAKQNESPFVPRKPNQFFKIKLSSG